MIKLNLPGPDRRYILYPLKYGLDAAHEGEYSLFVVRGVYIGGLYQLNPSTLLATLEDGERIIASGDFHELLEVVKSLPPPWKEDRMMTYEGPKYRKISPSLHDMMLAIDQYKNL
ncbi:hypothetical protein ACU063_23785 [Paenibacillus sp. M.A.Huq-81]